MRLIKRANPPDTPTGKSFWDIELSDEDLKQIDKGGFAFVEAVLPLSEPNLDLVIMKESVSEGKRKGFAEDRVREIRGRPSDPPRGPRR